MLTEKQRIGRRRRFTSSTPQTYFYIVSVRCLNCGATPTLGRTTLRKPNLDGRTMREANLVVDTGFIVAVDELDACRCGEMFRYDPARTEIVLRRE